MENIPEISEMPSAKLDSPAVLMGSTPMDTKTLSLIGTVTLKVARSEADISEHFVVTFAKPGTLTCHDLLNMSSINEMLSEAETKGVQISEPALLVSSGDGRGKSKTLYLTPAPDANFRDFAVWVGHVSDTISKIKATQVGLYLCKDSLPSDDLIELVGQTVRSLVESKAVIDISLIVGQHTYNKILSTALNLKQELETGDVKLQVLH